MFAQTCKMNQIHEIHMDTFGTAFSCKHKTERIYKFWAETRLASENFQYLCTIDCLKLLVKNFENQFYIIIIICTLIS